MEATPQATILMIGNDPSLAYLIERYAQQGGYGVTSLPTSPTADQACALQPAAVLFQSVEGLETSQILIRELADCDIPILVCSSISDEAKARELGADRCLLHPLSYDSVLEALTAAES